MKIIEICESVLKRQPVNELFNPSTEKLSVGSTGPAVKAWQWSLAKVGYPVGSVDGQFGPKTKSVTADFQQDKGLPTDGSVARDEYSTINTELKTKGISQFPATLQKEFDDLTQNYRPIKPQDLPSADTLSKDTNIPHTTTLSGIEGKVLDWISQFESAGHYDMMYGGKRYPEILDMTLNELVAFQRKHIGNLKRKGFKAPTSAAGRYQFITQTLVATAKDMGLDFNTVKFSPETQDQMIVHVLKKYRGMDKWMAGKLSTKGFLKNLSQEFASLPNPETGVSYYQGVGDNKAGTKVATAVNQLTKIRLA